MDSRIKMRFYEFEQGSIVQNSTNSTLWKTFSFTFSTIGMSLSTFALVLLITTAVLFVEWRKSYKNQLLIQFMVARFFYTFVRYFNDIQFIFEDAPSLNHLVKSDVLLLIYSEMVLVAWMFIFSRQMYLSLVKVFDTEPVKVWKVSICAWIVPGVISAILVLTYNLQDKTIRFIIYTMIVKWPVLIVNAILLIIVLKSVLLNNTNTRYNIKITVVMMVMIFVFCFQQMFIDIYRVIYIIANASCIMAITLSTSNMVTMYHCAFSILFWLFGNENTRKLWKFPNKGLRSKMKLNVRFSS